MIFFGPFVQMKKTPDYESGDEGLIPSGATILAWSNRKRREPSKLDDAGSNPAAGTSVI